MCLFQFSTCFEQPRAPQQDNQLCQHNIWLMSLCVGDRLVCRSERKTDTEWHIADVVLTQLILLIMSTRLLETCKAHLERAFLHYVSQLSVNTNEQCL